MSKVNDKKLIALCFGAAAVGAVVGFAGALYTITSMLKRRKLEQEHCTAPYIENERLTPAPEPLSRRAPAVHVPEPSVQEIEASAPAVQESEAAAPAVQEPEVAAAETSEE